MIFIIIYIHSRVGGKTLAPFFSSYYNYLFSLLRMPRLPTKYWSILPVLAQPSITAFQDRRNQALILLVALFLLLQSLL